MDFFTDEYLEEFNAGIVNPHQIFDQESSNDEKRVDSFDYNDASVLDILKTNVRDHIFEISDDDIESSDEGIIDSNDEYESDSTLIQKWCRIVESNSIIPTQNQQINFSQLVERIDKKFLCKICKSVFDVHSNIVKHVQQHIKLRPYQCFTCEESFRTISSLGKHAETHANGAQLYSCKGCQKYFPKRELTNHAKSSTANAPYICDTCDKTFTTECLLKSHLLLHPWTGERRFVCEVCGKKFRKKERLKSHSDIHVDVININEEICEDSISIPDLKTKIDDYNELRSNLLVIPWTGDRPFVCDKCGKKFRKNERLEAHSEIHGKIEKVACKICGLLFPDSEIDLHKHITHQKTYSCEICPAKFQFKNPFLDHVNRHKGRTNFQCEICQKILKNSASLNRHKLSHSTERPFKCDLCEKTFKDRHSVKMHATIHTGERPFLCSFCNQAFREKSKVKKHCLYRHEEELNQNLPFWKSNELIKKT